MWAAVAVLGGIAFLSALVLGVASRFFAVEVNPKIKAIEEILPGANCGGCGFAGCSGFAEAIASEKADPAGCAVGGSKVGEKISQILGIEVYIGPKKVARVFCNGGSVNAYDKYDYKGIKDCRAASLIAGGSKLCAYGCLGYGTCIQACHFGAIHIGDNLLPVIDPEKCVGCGTCARICPRSLIHLVTEGQEYIVLCSSHDKGSAVKSACKTGCIACQICVKKCPGEAIRMDNSLAVIDPDKCTKCGICREKCPQKTIWYSGRNVN